MKNEQRPSICHVSDTWKQVAPYVFIVVSIAVMIGIYAIFKHR